MSRWLASVDHIQQLEGAASAMIRAIVSGEIGPNTAITRQLVSDRYRVSREFADLLLHRMEVNRVLEADGWCSYRVPVLEPTDLKSLFRIRLLIETEMAPVAAKLIDTSQCVIEDLDATSTFSALDRYESVLGTLEATMGSVLTNIELQTIRPCWHQTERHLNIALSRKDDIPGICREEMRDQSIKILNLLLMERFEEVENAYHSMLELLLDISLRATVLN